ncbi:MAG TPA: hypothetical protein VFJ97_16290 [Dermatophilaceae bacterium]|nr:hypothetical protein [Dermatophilaceae bacterium]
MFSHVHPTLAEVAAAGLVATAIAVGASGLPDPAVAEGVVRVVRAVTPGDALLAAPVVRRLLRELVH